MGTSPWSTPPPLAARTTWDSLSPAPMEVLLPQLPLLRRTRLRSVRPKPRLTLRPGGTETSTTDGTATTPPIGPTTTTHTDTDSTTSADAGTTTAPSSPALKRPDDAAFFVIITDTLIINCLSFAYFVQYRLETMSLSDTNSTKCSNIFCQQEKLPLAYPQTVQK